MSEVTVESIWVPLCQHSTFLHTFLETFERFPLFYPSDQDRLCNTPTSSGVKALGFFQLAL